MKEHSPARKKDKHGQWSVIGLSHLQGAHRAMHTGLWKRMALARPMQDDTKLFLLVLPCLVLCFPMIVLCLVNIHRLSDLTFHPLSQ